MNFRRERERARARDIYIYREREKLEIECVLHGYVSKEFHLSFSLYIFM
jgi:hypothetical protein